MIDQFESMLTRREQRAVDELNECGMLRCLLAFAKRQGMKIPTAKVRDVTEEDHARIRAAREAVSEELWLRPFGARDALAIELELTPEQIAAVLAAQTKTAQSASADPRPAAEPAPAPRAEPRRTATPRNGKPPPAVEGAFAWPDRRTPKNGAVNQPPRAKEYDVDDEDRTLTVTMREQCRREERQSGTDPWPATILKIATHRRLTLQQVRGIVARHTPDPIHGQAPAEA